MSYTYTFPCQLEGAQRSLFVAYLENYRDFISVKFPRAIGDMELEFASILSTEQIEEIKKVASRLLQVERDAVLLSEGEPLPPLSDPELEELISTFPDPALRAILSSLHSKTKGDSRPQPTA